MSSDISKIREDAFSAIKKASSLIDLEKSRVIFLGRKSDLRGLLRSLGDKTPEEKIEVGQEANKLKVEITGEFEKRKAELEHEKIEGLINRKGIDVTVPGKRRRTGSLHPLTLVRRDIEKIFGEMGFYTLEGPEVETEWYNFDALNIPRNHPARDMQDTLWINREEDPNESKLLRTQTSPMQIRFMEKHEPPFRIISPGRIFRREATDATHEMQFHQIEGLMVDRDVSLANLKGVLEYFLSKLFNKNISVKFTASYFPFTEPSVEVHLQCVKCQGGGCPLCKNTGWIEVGGAGMVNQNVFKAAGYVPGEWQGFAFGMGLERLAMIKYGIDDIRFFFGSDLRFLKQF